jgi:hypothetical protein
MDEVLLGHAQARRAGHTSDLGCMDRRHDQDDQPGLRSDQADEEQGQDGLGKGQRHIEQPHDDLIGRSLDVAGGKPEQTTEKTIMRRRRRQPRGSVAAAEHAGEHVAAQHVGAEPSCGRRSPKGMPTNSVGEAGARKGPSKASRMTARGAEESDGAEAMPAPPAQRDWATRAVWRGARRGSRTPPCALSELRVTSTATTSAVMLTTT